MIANSALVDVYLAEYNRLKDEQRARIIARDHLMYITLTVVAAIAFFAFDGPSPRPSALLLLPPAGFILGWIYLINDWKVSDIGRYIRINLTDALNSCTRSDGLLAWESVHKRRTHRRRRKLVQISVDLLVFCIPGCVAIAAYAITTPARSVLLLTISCLELLTLALLAVEIVRNSDLTTENKE
jgi:hypothetical protein